jgi:hypothetical protein
MTDGYAHVLYNTCYGGFSVSRAAVKEYMKLRPDVNYLCTERNVPRHDPDMVRVVQTLGERANGECARIAIKRIPVEYVGYYVIGEYDGMEDVMIKYDKFKLDSVKSILKDGALSKSDKLARISAVVHMREDEDDEKDDLT